MKNLIRFKKFERDSLIDQILDYWLDYASTADLVKEVRSLHVNGFAKDFVPYAKMTDEELCEVAFETFDTTHYEDIREFFEMIMETEKRTDKASQYFWRKYNDNKVGRTK